MKKSYKMEQKYKKEKERERKKQQKEEEKRKKIEERLKMNEERKRKKEQQKRNKKTEEFEKKEKAKAAFVRFFVPKKSRSNETTEDHHAAQGKFMPFMVKGNMRVAPIVREYLNPETKVAADVAIATQSKSELYLSELKKKLRNPKKSPNTWPISELKNDIMDMEDEEGIPVNRDGLILDNRKDLRLRAKLLLFCENRRPPYWGTWRKSSLNVGPRRPFAKDNDFFDYEVDSDEEWIENEPGELLHGSDEDEKESEDEYEVDYEFFVPHGYLSAEEDVADENQDNNNDMSQETTHEAKFNLLRMEFEKEMKRETKQLRPQIWGLFWDNELMDERLRQQYSRIFTPYKAELCFGNIPTSFNTSKNNIAAFG